MKSCSSLVEYLQPIWYYIPRIERIMIKAVAEIRIAFDAMICFDEGASFLTIETGGVGDGVGHDAPGEAVVAEVSVTFGATCMTFVWLSSDMPDPQSADNVTVPETGALKMYLDAVVPELTPLHMPAIVTVAAFSSVSRVPALMANA